jgi:gp16 family phage-associated protein
MAAKKLLTPAQAYETHFVKKGVSQARWARENGFCKTLVSQILAGKRRALRGQSHKIAVLLGIKDGDFF